MSDLNQNAQLIAAITPLVEPLGYEIVHLEVQTHRQKILRIFIDRLNPADSKGTEAAAGGGVGIEDCVKVTRALDEPLDKLPEIERLFPSGYELEVSSPGVDRPLRTSRDFERFAGREVRVHVFRPLTGEEIENASYQNRNPKQKNFLGTLVGFRGDKVRLAVGLSGGGADRKPGKKGKAASAGPATNSAEEVAIPLPLISKANLEPNFDEVLAGSDG